MAGWLAAAIRRRVAPTAVFALAVIMPSAACATDLASAPKPVISPSTEFSSPCGGQNNEIEQAVWHQYVYEEWIGCGDRFYNIGFAVSSDGGLHFSKPVLLPGSLGGWDPALSVAPTGTVYAAFMTATPGHYFPVVEASFNHGKTFPQVRRLTGGKLNDWGDRDFIAVSRTGAIYLTWDYGPSRKKVKIVCPPGGSCAFAAGDLNIVLRKSTDGGRTWGPMVHISPGYPAGGGDAAPLLVAPDGKIYVDYHAYRVTNRSKLTLGPAHNFFTSSADGGTTWSKPVRIGPAGLTTDTAEWWIDGDISADSAGNLYATWDSQVRGRDIGWLAYSTNHGRTWQTVRVTPDTDNATHIVQVAGGRRGIAYVGWLADNSRHGYALYLREFSIRRGWVSPVIRASGRVYGNKAVWPGDTFGISVEPGVRTGPLASRSRVVVSWGSAARKVSEDRAAIVTFG